MRLPLLLVLAPALLAAGPPNPAAHDPEPAKPKPQAPEAGPPPLRAALGPNAAADAIRRILLAPYAQATGTKLADAPWDGGIESLRKLQSDHAADLALVDGATLIAACNGQTVEKLDWTRLVRTRFLAGLTTDCGAGALANATVLAWDREKLTPDKPDAADPIWSDFWDVAKHPGRRGLQRGARGNLEIALMADGVAAGDIYKTLRTPDGLDRAFRKLDQLKPYILWWDQPAQAAQLLAAGKVLLTSAPASTLAQPASPAQHLKLGVQWAGSLGEVKSWVILQGAPHETAMAALLIATDPARQVELARASGLGPTTADAASLLPAELRATSPGTQANLKAGLPIDEAFWQDNHGAVEARFTAWLAK